MSLHTTPLLASYYDRQTRRFHTLTRRVKTRMPAAYYEAHPWVNTRDPRCFLTQAGTLERLDTAERTVRFMDVTGLKPSQAWTRVVGRGGTYPSGFDHTCVWRLGRRYIVTTEPYRDRVRSDIALWLLGHGWTWLCLPDLGMWNPPATMLYVCSPPPLKGVALETLLEKVGGAA